MSYRARRSYGYDQDDRLPHGMSRIGYDADSQIYTYRDADGSIWHGPRGCEYGVLTRVRRSYRPAPPAAARERPRAVSLPAYSTNADLDENLPKYSRDCEPGHRTLLSRLLSSARARIPPPVPPKDVPKRAKTLRSPPVSTGDTPETSKDLPEPSGDIPELAYLRLGPGVVDPPPVPPKDAPMSSRRHSSAKATISSILSARNDG